MSKHPMDGEDLVYGGSFSDRGAGVAVPPEQDGWKRVSFAADCGLSDDGELNGECSICGMDYAEECECPGPTQEDLYEYREFDGVLYARPLCQPGTDDTMH